MLPFTGPYRMYVCICAAVTDRQIAKAVGDGAATLDDLACCLGVGTGCGCCREAAQAMLDGARVDATDAGPRPALHAREIARVAAPAQRV